MILSRTKILCYNKKIRDFPIQTTKTDHKYEFLTRIFLLLKTNKNNNIRNYYQKIE